MNVFAFLLRKIRKGGIVAESKIYNLIKQRKDVGIKKKQACRTRMRKEIGQTFDVCFFIFQKNELYGLALPKGRQLLAA